MNKIKRCLNCKKKFDRPFRPNSLYKISWVNYEKMVFCSNKCRGQDLSKKNTGSNNPNWRGGKTKCITCDKELASRYTSRDTNRCKECWYKFHRKENHIRWKGGSYCADCNKPIYHGDTRCQKCWAKRNTGRNNPRFKDRLTYKYLHVVIRKKLGHPDTCELCGFKSDNHNMIQWANKTGKYLRDPEDWLALCVKCHRKYDLSRKH